tara:strand:+ start:578 stop:910 length:333 start_codon:yes stop_codon:yes gene_type:complete
MSSVKTTLRNPIVTIWENSVSEDYKGQGIVGSMNLSTASKLHEFENPTILADALVMLGKGTRLRVSDKQYANSGSGIYLEYNPDGTDFHMAEDEAHPENIKYDERGDLIA